MKNESSKLWPVGAEYDWWQWKGWWCQCLERCILFRLTSQLAPIYFPLLSNYMATMATMAIMVNLPCVAPYLMFQSLSSLLRDNACCTDFTESFVGAERETKMQPQTGRFACSSVWLAGRRQYTTIISLGSGTNKTHPCLRHSLTFWRRYTCRNLSRLDLCGQQQCIAYISTIFFALLSPTDLITLHTASSETITAAI